MTMKSAIATMIFATASFVALGDVTYTGGSATDPRDLSLSDNWSAAPTSGDVAAIDMSLASGTAFTLSGALSVKGLSFSNVSAALSVAGPGTLTLGEGGIVLDAGQSFTLTAPVTTTAAQTWNFTTAAGTFTCGAKVSGTADLAWTAYAIKVSEPPNYGGKIVVSTRNAWDSYFQITKKGRIASSVTFNNGYFYQNFAGAWSPSDLVGDGNLNLGGWNYPYFNANSSNANVLNIGPGEAIKSEGSAARFVRGAVNQTGGDVQLNNLVSAGIEFWGNANDKTFEYNISGGTFKSVTTSYDTSSLNIGNRNTSGRASVKLNQSGGTVSFKTGVYVGGLGGTSTSISEYNMSGGTFTPARAAAGNGLVFAANCMKVDSGQLDYGQTSVGVFSQNGGETDALRVRWGYGKDTYVTTSPTSVLEGFGIFDLSGGLFKVGEDGFCVHEATWNTNSTGVAVADPNSAYRIRLRGGTLQPKAALVNKMQWEVEPSGDPDGFTLDTSNGNADILAPVWGSGKFRKTGSGVLTVVDMTRFTGEFAVDAGTVEVLGSYSDAWTDGAIVFTGDGAAAGLANATNDAPVASWAADAGGISAVEIEPAEGKWQPGLPKLAVDAFNGHAGLKFGSSGLRVPVGSNPIANQTKWSAVVVFKDTVGGNGSDQNDYTWIYDRAIFGWTIDYRYNEYALVYAKTSGDLSNALMFGVGYKESSGSGYVSQCAPKGNLNDGKVHVAICSMAGNQTTLNVDGGFVTNVVATSHTGTYPRYDGPLYIGLNGMRNSSQNLQASSFAGTMAEIRIYTNRVLTVAEQNGLARALRAKYAGDDVVDMAHDTPAAAAGSLVSSGPSVPSLPAGANVWSAGSIGDADGAGVSSWVSDTGISAAAGTAAPVLVKNAVNGRAGLRFAAEDRTSLSVSASDSPVSGQSAFAAAVVFRTTTDSTDENVVRGGMGLVSTVVGTSNANDFSLSLQKEGSVRGLYGGTSANVSCWTRKPCRLADGTPHVAVISADPDGGQLRLMTDGLVCRTALSSGAARTANPLVFGSHAASLNKHFTGYIAEVVVWSHALSEAEMSAATEHLAAQYSFRPLAKYPFGLEKTLARGIGATNIAVAAGATLRLPQSATAPLTLGAGQSVSGAGEIQGSVRFGVGSVVDFGSTLPAIDDVQLAGCTLRFPAVDAGAFSMPNVSSVSGGITVDVSAWKGVGSMPSRVNLVQFDPAVVDAGTTFTLTGLDGRSSINYDSETGMLQMRSQSGSIIIFR